MKENGKPTLLWALDTLRALSGQGYSGSVTIRFRQGGVQGMAVNQELHPSQSDHIADPQERSQS
jgi:hypothetical protein